MPGPRAAHRSGWCGRRHCERRRGRSDIGCCGGLGPSLRLGYGARRGDELCCRCGLCCIGGHRRFVSSGNGCGRFNGRRFRRGGWLLRRNGVLRRELCWCGRWCRCERGFDRWCDGYGRRRRSCFHGLHCHWRDGRRDDCRSQLLRGRSRLSRDRFCRRPEITFGTRHHRGAGIGVGGWRRKRRRFSGRLGSLPGRCELNRQQGLPFSEWMLQHVAAERVARPESGGGHHRLRPITQGHVPNRHGCSLGQRPQRHEDRLALHARLRLCQSDIERPIDPHRRCRAGDERCCEDGDGPRPVRPCRSSALSLSGTHDVFFRRCLSLVRRNGDAIPTSGIDTTGRVRKACGAKGLLLARTPQTRDRDRLAPSRRPLQFACLEAQARGGTKNETKGVRPVATSF